ncbi:hypothetical protein MCOR27_006741 [Pyricularia oryzae]|uniref:endo-polygalacturonase n=2 Tax=Pyricularia TaxID=48558 RepID=A0ABQ8NQZ4_PYRGI|nr:hypothetical protein MCOR01_010753 [Pyricularia oryzae]KAI6300784.1 hypothetical protein MCOR33_003530 [Pyricularia grisea]KAH9438227.1 hypothetical protein MCOR02_001864 [Pyricularia oryzae]KAI6263706.1 hypothetical protein MCOR19_000038 [Pyricularia oryzae]KAI6275903.1 hypothetical protein MCOR27_006741 [Pyricularia oryzae]
MLVRAVVLAAISQVVRCIPVGAADAGQECVFGGSDGVARIGRSKASCSSLVISAMEIAAGETLDLTNLREGSTIIFRGTTSFGHAEGGGHVFSISGSRINIHCDQDCTLLGPGAQAQTGVGGSSALFHLENLVDSSIAGLNIKNAPAHGLLLNSVQNLSIRNVSIDGGAGGGTGRGAAGFTISNSSNVVIDGSTVRGQDGCVAVDSGSNIAFTNGLCSNGNGITIGPAGRSTTAISNITVSDTTIEKARVAAIQVQSYAGGSGAIDGVTFRNILIDGGGAPGSGIVVDQAFDSRDQTLTPPNGVTFFDLRMRNVTGTVGQGAANVSIRCGLGDCHDWSWEGVSVTGGGRAVDCVNLPKGVSC